MMNTFLFVPASRLERVAKAVNSGADAVIIDLEDAVIGQDKAALYQALEEFGRLWRWQDFNAIWLRINNVQHTDFKEDLLLAARLPIHGIILPKVKSAQQIEQVYQVINKPIIAMIECATGMLNIADISKAKGLLTLSYGCLDLAVGLGVCVGTPSARLLFDRLKVDLLLHTHINGLQPPIETIFPDISDDKGFIESVQAWQDLGFGGQFFIHPKQVSLFKANQATKQLTFAKQVVAHHQKDKQAVFCVDGKMVDKPVIDWAYDYLKRHHLTD